MKNSFEIWIAEWRHAKCCINFYYLISDMIDNVSFFFRSRILKSRKWKSFSRSMSILPAVMINQTGLQNWTKPSKKKAAVTASSISPYLPLSMRRSHWISRLSVCPKGESFISLNIKLSQSLNLKWVIYLTEISFALSYYNIWLVVGSYCSFISTETNGHVLWWRSRLVRTSRALISYPITLELCLRRRKSTESTIISARKWCRISWC